jgi:hypothetical protein
VDVLGQVATLWPNCSCIHPWLPVASLQPCFHTNLRLSSPHSLRTAHLSKEKLENRVSNFLFMVHLPNPTWCNTSALVACTSCEPCPIQCCTWLTLVIICSLVVNMEPQIHSIHVDHMATVSILFFPFIFLYFFNFPC